MPDKDKKVIVTEPIKTTTPFDDLKHQNTYTPAKNTLDPKDPPKSES